MTYLTKKYACMKSITGKALAIFDLRILLIASVSTFAHSEPIIDIELSLPKLNVDPYHRPYVAIWLETLEREPVATLAVWHEDEQWLKDLRQWWRKIGRGLGPDVDALTGATRRPGVYSVSWNGENQNLQVPMSGEYLLNIEASREEGGRTYLRKSISLANNTQISIPAKDEFGEIHIKINKVHN